ncbi:MAG: LysM domain-containing protein [Candidatus Doudnabacteria bacterium]|nr:LysM domain-containing protein [Candidatus Doudnabacteria bacterium]
MAFGNKKFELSPRLRLGVGRGSTQNQILKIAAILCLVAAVILTANAVRLVIGSKNHTSNNGQNPQVLGASDSNQPAAGQTQVQFVSYTVQKGDTLFDISQKYNISWNTLATLNNLKSPFILKAGQTLNIPKQQN